MKKRILIITTFFVLNKVYAQIWNYPPASVSNWQENESIPKDSLKLLKVWNHEIVDGRETGQKDLKLTQEFDTLGNTISLIYGNTNADPILFSHYIHGFWQMKLVDGRVIHQNVTFDSAGNVIQQSINDLVITYTYDSMNRPVKKEHTGELYLWNYDDENLKSYHVYKDGILNESRMYYHDPENGSIAYTTQFFDSKGIPYPYPDSVIAFFGDEKFPARIESYFHDSSGRDTLIITMDLTGKTIYKYTDSCTRTEMFRDELGVKRYFEVYNCEGILQRKTSYEYVYED